MPYFPLFIDLTGRRCVVVGGGPVGARKVKTLLDFGAAVTVLDPSPSDEVRALSPPAILTERMYRGPEDLAGAVLVIGAVNKPDLSLRLSQDAQSLGIPVNLADAPERCTFFFPAVVRRGELVAGISTSGGCPRLAARLRERLETLWSPDLGEALETLKAERARLKARGDTREKTSALDALIAQAVDIIP